MEDWQHSFEKWLTKSAGLAPSTAKSYSRIVIRTGIITGKDPSIVTTMDKFYEFHTAAYSNSDFNEKNKSSRWGVPIAQFHDYLLSNEDPNWPKSKWIGNTVTSDENKRCRIAMEMKNKSKK